MSRDTVKQRVEAKYEHETRTDEIGTDYAGQLTILFCTGDLTSSNFSD